jgi:acetyl/propionyl-CoA carboxylase alpha subunit
MPVICKLLIANRGEIARRIMRTARQHAISTVAVYSDADAGAPFVEEADESVRLPGDAPSQTYLDIDRIIDAALSAGADAVHPGYGFLSENGRFARACAAAGLTFVGPSPEVIETMGSKLAAKELMADAGVPVLPGATVTGAADVEEAIERVGLPLLVKAAFGGGGRGMRVVRSATDAAEAIASAEREATSAFGDGTVFLERFVEDPRHIEVQIFGDHHGNVVHLFERECSIQRRYQKIIEEAPSPAVDDALRKELGSAAVTAARALGYVGAGTVEFVVDSDGRFFFLEVNTRLQVEHPVTELVTGLDLVHLQLLVAQGEALPTEVLNAQLSGHAIEARLYAEDVAAGFMPVSGPIRRFRVPAVDGVRVDSGFEDGSTVSTHYDAMLAKVIAWAPTRSEASRRLAGALARSQIHGVVTNRDLLVGILRHPEFESGRTDTGFLQRHDPAGLATAASSPDATAVHAVAAALAGQASRRAAATQQPGIPSGWRNVSGPWQRTAFVHNGTTTEVEYRRHDGALNIRVDGDDRDDIDVVSAHADGVQLVVRGVRRRMDVHQVGPSWYVDSELGSSDFEEVDRFPLPETSAAPGSLLAPMPGSVVRVLVECGHQVVAGDTLVVLEAMKMEHAIRSPHDGVVTELRVSAGQQVESGAVLAVVETEAG